MYKAKFINQTNLPIMVDGLVKVMEGLNKLETKVVKGNEECIITSITGEWFINTFFNDRELKKIWILNKLNHISNIGKFRNSPCISGEYSWMDVDEFIITHEEEDGVHTFKFNLS